MLHKTKLIWGPFLIKQLDQTNIGEKDSIEYGLGLGFCFVAKWACLNSLPN